MPRYLVTQIDTVSYHYEVEAPSRDAAKELVLSGECNPVDKDDNVDAVEVEEINP